MDEEQLWRLAQERARQQAKEVISGRLWLISAVIWMVGIAVLYLLVWLPQQVRPSRATLQSLALFIPAALPWLAYPRLVAAEARRRVDAEYAALKSERRDAVGE